MDILTSGKRVCPLPVLHLDSVPLNLAGDIRNQINPDILQNKRYGYQSTDG